MKQYGCDCVGLLSSRRADNNTMEGNIADAQANDLYYETAPGDF